MTGGGVKGHQLVSWRDLINGAPFAAASRESVLCSQSLSPEAAFSFRKAADCVKHDDREIYTRGGGSGGGGVSKQLQRMQPCPRTYSIRIVCVSSCGIQSARLSPLFLSLDPEREGEGNRRGEKLVLLLNECPKGPMLARGRRLLRVLLTNLPSTHDSR